MWGCDQKATSSTSFFMALRSADDLARDVRASVCAAATRAMSAERRAISDASRASRRDAAFAALVQTGLSSQSVQGDNLLRWVLDAAPLSDKAESPCTL